MNERIIEFDPLIEGVLIKRYKRFLADIKLESGEIVTAHCANTGPMKGLLTERAKVRISVSPSPKRKLPFTLEQISVLGTNNNEVWVGINTLFANKLIKKVIFVLEKRKHLFLLSHSRSRVPSLVLYWHNVQLLTLQSVTLYLQETFYTS